MTVPHLVIAAYWSMESPERATTRLVDAIRAHAEPGSLPAVSIAAPDGRLAAWLRSVQLAEAAGYEQRTRDSA